MVKRWWFKFIDYVDYEKLFLFCLNCKTIDHDPSNCKSLQYDVTIISDEEKSINTKTTTLLSKVVIAQDEANDSLAQLVEFMVKLVVKSIIKLTYYDTTCCLVTT